MDLRIGKSEMPARGKRNSWMRIAISGAFVCCQPACRRACHHCASTIALVTGRSFARPGGPMRASLLLREVWKDIGMKLPHAPATATALTILAAAIALPAPTHAQTYDPSYPVCLQVYQGMVDFYFECHYRTMAQCAASASGRAAH